MATSINPQIAADAYSRMAQSATSNKGVEGGDNAAPSFRDFLVDKTRDAIDVLRKGEDMTAKAVSGNAPLPALVQAVTNADTTLQTIVALRDRMISAYQDIMRMPL